MLQFTQARKRGLFGMPDYMAPGGGIGGGLDGAVQETAPGNPGSSAEPRKKKGGLFGSGIRLRDVLGTLGDAVAINRGMSPIYAAQQHEARLLEQRQTLEEQQYQRRRQAELEDYEAKQGIEARYRPAPRNDTIEDVKWYLGASPEERAAYDAMHPVYRTGLDGLPYPMARTSIPQAPVGKLTPLPEGGPAPAGRRPFSGALPVRLNSGFMTSGRRTPEGNALVGGVPNSKHLTGEAADYWGKDLGAVLREAQGLPGVRRAFIHGKGGKRHVHTEGDWNAPYVGRRGTKGLKR